MTTDHTPDQSGRGDDVPAAESKETAAVGVGDSDDADEGRDAYHPGGFHPVYIGDVYAEKYEVMRKIGYGRYSTVWMVKDLSKPRSNHEHRFRALKVLSAECYGADQPVFEREILKHLRASNQDLPGHKYICHLVDDFKHKGPNGTHVCLVFELMGETLSTFGTYFRECLIPTPVMRKFSAQLILALHFAHASNVIHTDIKQDNIFIKFQDTSRIESEFLVNYPAPEQDRTEARYTPISSRPLIGYYTTVDPRSDPTFRLFGLFNIALGDWGVSSWADKHLTENIQPVALRAPEVLVKAPWTTTADWWNLGALIIEVYRAVRLFSGMVPPDGHYELREHLAEIVDHFGPFPKELLAQGDGELVKSMFDDEGRIKGVKSSGVPPLEDEVWWSGLAQNEVDLFLSFLRCMMKVNPADRVPAEELVQHSWISKNLNR
ncbi:kinase-like domain-containing protein [Apiosordaria backusii]|uniref:non-specific serine/threonine protein kinase n=1 Tax=Apiosordaria backusii TaxID=314023 RepID=A0AA40BS66_9PEZI|nr:kinase-like domain-containing protein [Apiosordaria backusii]